MKHTILQDFDLHAGIAQGNVSPRKIHVEQPVFVDNVVHLVIQYNNRDQYLICIGGKRHTAGFCIWSLDVIEPIGCIYCQMKYL